MKILIVDDSKLVRATMRKKLSQVGMTEVIEAESVASAMALLNSTSDVEIVLTDYEMPQAGGTELLRQVRGLGSGARIGVILVTGHDLNTEERAELAIKGFDGVADKGIEADDLRAVVEAAWNKRCSSRSRFSKGLVSKHEPEPIKLAGFNNLTKVLSFNLYDFAIAQSEEERQAYVRYIDEAYSARRIAEISRGICAIIEAQVLDISLQDYDPHGASTLVLMSDLKHDSPNAPGSSAVHAHLNKSHICAHTYPDTLAPNGICTFRVDIDIATCGEITPLKALNFMFNSFEADVVVMDYVVRGYTRDTAGRKVYNDLHTFNTIRDFIAPDILEHYQRFEDMNIPPANTWQTKLMVGDLRPEDYFLDSKSLNSKSMDETRVEPLLQQLRKEMREIYYMHQV